MGAFNILVLIFSYFNILHSKFAITAHLLLSPHTYFCNHLPFLLIAMILYKNARRVLVLSKNTLEGGYGLFAAVHLTAYALMLLDYLRYASHLCSLSGLVLELGVGLMVDFGEGGWVLLVFHIVKYYDAINR